MSHQLLAEVKQNCISACCQPSAVGHAGFQRGGASADLAPQVVATLTSISAMCGSGAADPAAHLAAVSALCNAHLVLQ